MRIGGIVSIWAVLCVSPLALEGQCVNFPSSLIPFSTINYVTAADSAGDHLVVGALAGTLGSVSALPQAASTNQTFCGLVQLAPQQVYASVYVQTAAEQAGNFPEFAGLLVDPLNNNQPFTGGIIPTSRLGGIYAFRIGPAQPPQQPAWALTGSMGYGWVQHVAVPLPSGQVLITGFCQGCNTPVALLYDPPTGTFLPAGAPQFLHGAGATGTLLNNGLVLIVGGIQAPNAAELYNSATNQFTAVQSSSFTHYEDFTATLLNDGRVLVAGGQNVDNTAVAEAEIFDPSIETWVKIGAMVQARANHTATRLPNGTVLIAGGCNTNKCFNSAELFSTANQGTFSATGSMYNIRDGAYAVLLPNGKVLVGGGDDSPLPPAAELYDPTKGTFSTTGSMLAGVVERASATLLSSGQVLISGGDYVLPSLRVALVSAELYDPASGLFSLAGNMTVGRELGTTTLLPDGRVLVTGGEANPPSTTVYSSAEIYTPVVQGLVTSQTGVTFQSAPSGSPPAQTVDVLSPFNTIPWTLSVKTFSGGNWLSATPSSATSAANGAPIPVSITVNTGGLAAQTYYGSVTLTPTDGVHPPVSITVVLNIVPAGTAAPLEVSPGALVFVTAPNTTPLPQSFSITNVSSTAISFTASSTSTGKWLNVNQSGVVTSTQAVGITVTPVVGTLGVGIYPGSITLTFSNSTTQVVNLILVISSSVKPAARGAVPEATSSGCTPTQLVPVLTSLSSGFSVSAGWPVPVIVQIVDDCGNPINTGTVIASFTNGDSPLSLIAVGGGSWSATWVPGRGYSGAAVRVDANTVNPRAERKHFGERASGREPDGAGRFHGGCSECGRFFERACARLVDVDLRIWVGRQHPHGGVRTLAHTIGNHQRAAFERPIAADTVCRR